jgi:hypothetical protein
VAPQADPVTPRPPSAPDDVGWTHPSFRRLPASQVRWTEVQDALLSRADSGTIHWGRSKPRSYVRGAVHDREGRLVVRSQRVGAAKGDLVLTVNPTRLGETERRAAAGDVLTGRWLYAGHWMPGFGHFVVETLPRLWPLVSGECLPVRGTVAHRFTSGQAPGWQRGLLALVVPGGQVERVDDEPRSVETLVVADAPYQYQVAISARATQVWDAAASAAGDSLPADVGAAVFLSRSHLQEERARAAHGDDRHVANARELDDLFASRGFRVVFPETLPVVEQVRLARDAGVLAGMSGSALHLSAFQRAGRVVELGDRRSGAVLMPTQQALAAVRGHPVAQVPYREEARPHHLDLAHVGACLDRLLPRG